MIRRLQTIGKDSKKWGSRKHERVKEKDQLFLPNNKITPDFCKIGNYYK